MSKFVKQLTALVSRESAMKRAGENIKKDIQSQNQPLGNINPQVVAAIEKICSSKAENETGHVRDVVKNHQAVNMPGLYEPAPPPGKEPLRRALSLFSFVKYHILDGTQGNTYLGKSYSKQDLLPYYKDYLLDKFKQENPYLIDPDELQGSCGKPGDPCWWTFYEKHNSIPDSGETYMQELALSDMEMKNAEMDNTAVEISIAAEKLGLDLFKPTALDSFRPETRFEPELTGKKYGATAPLKQGLQSRPEIVSKSQAYRDFENRDKLPLTKFPYKNTI